MSYWVEAKNGIMLSPGASHMAAAEEQRNNGKVTNCDLDARNQVLNISIANRSPLVPDAVRLLR